jgi:hypothetical protein
VSNDVKDDKTRPALQFEYLFTLTAEVGELVSMGHAPLGERRMVGIHGGAFEGPKLRGTVGDGADWQIARADGVLELDARYVLKEERGGLIRVVSEGYRHGPPEVMARLGRGEDVDPADYFFRTTMRFETGAPELAWLNEVIAVATAQRKARRVELHAWRLL